MDIKKMVASYHLSRELARCFEMSTLYYWASPDEVVSRFKKTTMQENGARGEFIPAPLADELGHLLPKDWPAAHDPRHVITSTDYHKWKLLFFIDKDRPVESYHGSLADCLAESIVMLYQKHPPQKS